MIVSSSCNDLLDGWKQPGVPDREVVKALAVVFAVTQRASLHGQQHAAYSFCYNLPAVSSETNLQFLHWCAQRQVTITAVMSLSELLHLPIAIPNIGRLFDEDQLEKLFNAIQCGSNISLKSMGRDAQTLYEDICFHLY
ncbi:unnamed protein product [Clavelina lepadiformis]|uniref:Uncharacterized protein n=1 Tax=Clavelina lepadiformis TaxID=159417 RepID=A0ABP0FZ45_CLALP